MPLIISQDLFYGYNRFIQFKGGIWGPWIICMPLSGKIPGTLWDQQNTGRLSRDWYMSYYDLSGGHTAGVIKWLLPENYRPGPIKIPALQITPGGLNSGMLEILNAPGNYRIRCWTPLLK